MLADFFTKPLQGALFQKFRSILLGYEHTSQASASMMPKHEERVEYNEGRREGNKVHVSDDNVSPVKSERRDFFTGKLTKVRSLGGLSTRKNEECETVKNLDLVPDSTGWSVVVRKKRNSTNVRNEDSDSSTKELTIL
jgi:hypothetical protein